MAHIVKCVICQKMFDRDKIQAVEHGARRYSHYECEPNGKLVPLPEKPKEDEDLTKLKDYISLKYGDKANWVLITKQIKDFHENKKYSYSGMLKSLIYFYDVKNNSVEKSNGGIGIIDYMYNDAYNYYLGIFMAQQKTNVDFNPVIKEYTIPLPKAQTLKKKLLDWGTDNEE